MRRSPSPARAASGTSRRTEIHWQADFLAVNRRLPAGLLPGRFLPAGRLFPRRLLPRHAFRQLSAAGFAIPFLVGLIRDLAPDEELRELAPLRLALERHETD